MAKFFDVGITHGADDSITHTLSTTLIGPDGKVVAFLSWERVDAGAGDGGCDEVGGQCRMKFPRVVRPSIILADFLNSKNDIFKKIRRVKAR